MRGNNVMKGYFDDPGATAAAFAGGWFHSGDIAVMHADGGEIIDFCRAHLAHYKSRFAVEFGPLPKTSTGKIRKNVLREREWAGHRSAIN